MELEEAIKNVEFLIRDLKADNYNLTFIKAVKIVLQELKNRIPKKKIEDKIEEVNNKILKLQKENNYSSIEEIVLNQVKKFLKELLEDK